MPPRKDTHPTMIRPSSSLWNRALQYGAAHGLTANAVFLSLTAKGLEEWESQQKGDSIEETPHD